MIADVRDIQWVNALAKKNMMAIEAVVADVCAATCQGQSGFALFDGGAHKGYHTLRMGVLPGCEAVYAVEADPLMVETLQTKIDSARYSNDDAVFGADGREIHLIDKALQNDPETTEITWKSSSSHIGRSSIAASAEQDETIWAAGDDMEYRDDVTVQATTIDVILAKESRPIPFIKLDLEGADILSLMGARTTLKDKRPVVAFENSLHAPRVHGFTLDAFRAYLDDLDYLPVDFAGNVMTETDWFGFFEAWLVPKERQESFVNALDAALERQSERLVAEAHIPDIPDRVLSDDDDINAHIVDRFWSHPARLAQMIEEQIANSETEARPSFDARVLQTLEKLNEEEIAFHRADPSIYAFTPDIQWSLDAGRLARLLWQSGRTTLQATVGDLSEQSAWNDQAGSYRAYVKATLMHLRREGVRFSRDK